jgi:hypothetical protein
MKNEIYLCSDGMDNTTITTQQICRDYMRLLAYMFDTSYSYNYIFSTS